MSNHVCYICGKTGDLRPYGVNCSMVCFSCAMGTPERKADAERQFAGQFKAIRGPVVIDGSEAGPYPLEHHPQAAAALKAHQEKGNEAE